MRVIIRSISLFLAASALVPASGAAQERVRGPVRAEAEVAFIYAHPLGEFGDYIDRGYGGLAAMTVPLRPESPLGLRVEGGVVNYGRERHEVCLSPTIGCRVRVDLITSNDIFFAAAGPQLAVPAGPLRPYLYGAAGLAYFGTTSSVRGLADHDHFAHTTNFDDLTFSWGGGAGARVALTAGEIPVLLNLGVRYHDNGSVEYLREGDITDLPDGSIAISPQRSRADLLTVQLGATIGIRPRKRP